MGGFLQTTEPSKKRHPYAAQGLTSFRFRAFQRQNFGKPQPSWGCSFLALHFNRLVQHEMFVPKIRAPCCFLSF